MRVIRIITPVAGVLFAAAALAPLFAQLAAPSPTAAPVVPAASPPTVVAPAPVVNPITPVVPPATLPVSTISTSTSRVPSRLLRGLPDPVLLDGSKAEADKYPEYGMVGDFELPGEDVTEPSPNQRVGSNNPVPTAGGGAMSKSDPNQSGGGGGAQSKSGQPSAGRGGGNAGTQAGSKSPATNDPSATAQGIQVGELIIDESVAGSPQIDVTGVPVAIGIGDSAMAIKPVAEAAGVTGTESAGNTQQAGQNIGSASTGSNQGTTGGGGSNKGVERGKTMQSGL